MTTKNKNGDSAGNEENVSIEININDGESGETIVRGIGKSNYYLYKDIFSILIRDCAFHPSNKTWCIVIKKPTRRLCREFLGVV